MNNDTYFYDPSNDHGLAHDPFKAILAPRVIGWSSSCNAKGQPSLSEKRVFGDQPMAGEFVYFVPLRIAITSAPVRNLSK